MSPTMWDCEMDVVGKLIRIIESALKCSTSLNNNETDSINNSTEIVSELQETDRAFAKRFLEILISQNDTGLFEDPGISDMNTTNQVGQGNFPGGSINATPEPNPGRSIHKLQNLEIIKVVVLIVVISIIMLTTCRMVFQLFIRFRPEKPQD